jgi:hypothetical protein
MERKRAYALTGSFLAILLLLGPGTLLRPGHAYSETEARDLAAFPRHANLAAYGADFEAWVSDRFLGRERMLEVYSRLQGALGKTEQRDVYVTDGFLIPKEYRVQPPELAALAQAVRGFGETLDAGGAAAYYAFTPHKFSCLQHLLPAALRHDAGARNRADITAALDGSPVGVLDGAGYFLTQYDESARENFFYRTDFHWNASAAYTWFRYAVKSLQADGVLPPDALPGKSGFRFQSQERPYRGDLNRRFSYIYPMRETVTEVVPSGAEDFRYFLREEGAYKPVPRETIAGSRRDAAAPDYNELYTYNLPLYQIVNERAATGQKLLLVKDSMANPLGELFASVFAEVTVCDPRFPSDLSLRELLASEAFDAALFCYHEGQAPAELTGN